MRVEPERIQPLNDLEPDPDGRYVLYWMQQSQRAAHNPALEFALERANATGRPLLVAFGLMGDYPEASERHYRFMLEGLAETKKALAGRGVAFVIRHGHPLDVALQLGRDATEVVCDRGYLSHLRAWRDDLADEARCRVTRVEGDVVVPVELASDHPEHSARTIRPKLNRHRDRFIRGGTEKKAERSSLSLAVKSDVDLSDVDACLDRVGCDRSVPASRRFEGGTSVARDRLTRFLRSGLDGYAEGRNEPAADQTSHLSPYLQYGQISPVEVAYKIQRSKSGSNEDREAYLEEMIVRRELAHNHTEFRDDYDEPRCLPDWAKATLREHRDDPRPHRYSKARLEGAKTHDRYWNAAMREMTKTGYMHNYMRMYWGKKVLEWSKTPETAFRTLLHLNNRYFLDGLSPNSYANVGWIFGVHDRAWTEREVFGKVRYMNENGLRRKFDIEAYVAKWGQERFKP